MNPEDSTAVLAARAAFAPLAGDASDADALAFVMRCIAETPDLYVRKRDDLSAATRLREDLGIDSIGLVSLFYAITDALGVEGDEADAAELVTLGDTMVLARRLVGDSPG